MSGYGEGSLHDWERVLPPGLSGYRWVCRRCGASVPDSAQGTLRPSDDMPLWDDSVGAMVGCSWRVVREVLQS